MNQENKKNSRFIFAVVFIFCLVRSVVFTTEEFVGYYFEAEKFLFTPTVGLFWALSLSYSLMSAALISATFKKYGDKALLACILLIANPVFLINQKHLSVLLINVLYVLYLNCQILKKDTLKSVTQVLFLLISAIISPEVTLGFIPLIIFAEFFPDTGKKKNRLLPRVLSAAAVISGVALNKILISNIPQFNSITELLNTAYHAEAEKIVSTLVLSLPSLAIGAFFLYILDKRYKKSGKLNKKTQKGKNPLYAHLNILFAALILLIAASFFGGYQTLSALSLFAPVYLLQLVLSQDTVVDEAFTDADELIKKHSAPSAFIFVLMHYMCLRFYLEQFGGYIIADIFIINR